MKPCIRCWSRANAVRNGVSFSLQGLGTVLKNNMAIGLFESIGVTHSNFGHIITVRNDYPNLILIPPPRPVRNHVFTWRAMKPCRRCLLEPHWRNTSNIILCGCERRQAGCAGGPSTRPWNNYRLISERSFSWFVEIQSHTLQCSIGFFITSQWCVCVCVRGGGVL